MQPPDLADEILGYSAGGETEKSKGRPYVGPQGIGSWELGRKVEKRESQGSAVPGCSKDLKV